MIVELGFKEKRQELEFASVDDRIKAITLFAALMFGKIWSHKAVVTSIKRTPEENKSVGGVMASPHLDWRALDIRLRDFPHREHVGVLVDMINSAFPRSDGFKTALAHGKGDNFHLHLQVPKRRDL